MHKKGHLSTAFPLLKKVNSRQLKKFLIEVFENFIPQLTDVNEEIKYSE
ncbi:MAG: hypothetical protein RL264_3025 [Bacteroidota bacterium]|jgi:hypothetical protein